MNPTWRARPLAGWPKSLFQACSRIWPRIAELLRIPPPETPQVVRRIILMERYIVLPIKAAGLAMLLYFYLTPWTGRVNSALDVEVEAIQFFFWIYIAVNAVVAVLLVFSRRLPVAVLQWVVFATSLIDGVFLSSLTLVTGGYNSILYWLFLGLIVRSAVSVPRATSQIALNLTLMACYILAGVIEISVAENLDATWLGVLKLSEPPENPEPLVLRLVLLLLMTVCCYGVQVLLDKHRQALEEAREFAAREAQLHAAGRLAAEFTHQIKNPLAIIHTAAYSLQRAWKESKRDGSDQIAIIQEEVERCDRIITQIMDYAQLGEGHVEKVEVIAELDRAIKEVFPPAAGYPIQVQREYGSGFRPLLMLRRHVSEIFLNLLQNAREAMGERGGTVVVQAQSRADSTIEVSIADTGPGIAPEKHEKIFEAYYTTKERGTGLGLATVKHNVELYGGSVRVDSELGKGARFVVTFPARTLVGLEQQI